MKSIITEDYVGEAVLQNQTLIQIRDTFLLKLMSGEVRIPQEEE